MKRSLSSDRDLRGVVSAVSADEARGEFAVYVTARGDGAVMAGAHGGPWCWCQPEVTSRLPCLGHEHVRVRHRDLSDSPNASPGMDSGQP